METNLTTFLQLVDQRRKDAETNKASTVQIDLAKSAILEHMINNNQSCVTIRDDLHIVRVEKVSKIPLTQAEFLNTLFHKYCESHNLGCSDLVSSGFHTFCTAHQDRLAAKSQDLKISKRRPLSTLF